VDIIIKSNFSVFIFSSEGHHLQKRKKKNCAPKIKLCADKIRCAHLHLCILGVVKGFKNFDFDNIRAGF